MRDLGQSLDSKKVTSALGYLDLKQICFCLAQGIMKHITFSKGQFFLDDLKRQENQADDLEFSYNLGKDMRIDVEAAKLKRKEKQMANQSNFDQIKQQIETTANKTEYQTPQSLSNQKFDDFEVEERDNSDDNDSIKDETQEQVEVDDNYEEIQATEDIKTKQVQSKTDLAKFNSTNRHDDENLDMDYSQSHLDQFLKSQGANQLGAAF